MTALSQVSVITTNNRGHTPEEIAERCVARIISVAETAPPELRDQAEAFKQDILKVVVHYLREAVHSDRTTVYSALKGSGHPDLAELVRSL